MRQEAEEKLLAQVHGKRDGTIKLRSGKGTNNNNNNNNNIYFVSQGYTQSFTIFVQVDTGRSEFSELIESDCH